MQYIRKASLQDVSRIAEIQVFNNRVNYLPIFNDESFSFGTVQVLPTIEMLLSDLAFPDNTYVYDDGIIRGFLRIKGTEIKKLYVDTFFQNRGIGMKLLQFGIQYFEANTVWALEKNFGAIRFYQRGGFRLTGERRPEDGTTEYCVLLKR